MRLIGYTAAQIDTLSVNPAEIREAPVEVGTREDFVLPPPGWSGRGSVLDATARVTAIDDDTLYTSPWVPRALWTRAAPPSSSSC